MQFIKYFCFFLIFNFLYATNIKDTTKYVLDYSHSNISFKIKHLKVTDVLGVVKNFKAQINIKNHKITNLAGNINLDSIDTFNKERDQSIMKFFLKNLNAQIKFIESNNNKVHLNLTLNDIKKDIWLDYEITDTIENPYYVLQKNKTKQNPFLQQNMQNANNKIKNLKTYELDDCNCYATYGNNIVGIKLSGKIDRFDYKIASDIPNDLLDRFIYLDINIEASN